MRLLISCFLVLLSAGAWAQDYYVYVTAESEDEVSLIKFDGTKATVEKTITVGVWPAEIEGLPRPRPRERERALPPPPGGRARPPE